MRLKAIARERAEARKTCSIRALPRGFPKTALLIEYIWNRILCSLLRSVCVCPAQLLQQFFPSNMKGVWADNRSCCFDPTVYLLSVSSDRAENAPEKGRVSIEVRAQNSFRTVPRKDASNKRMRLCRGRDFEHAHGIEIHFQVMRTWLLRFIMLCSIKCPCSLLAVLYESALFPCSKGFDEQHGSSATSMGFAIEGFSMACVIVLPTSMQKWTLLDSTRDSSATPHALQGVKKVFRNNKDDEEFEEVRSYCNCKKTWRTKGSFQHTLPCALSVEQLVKGLYWFAPNIPLTTVQKEIGLTLKSLRELYYQIRLVMFSAALPKLGGLRRIVVVDETYFTRRKRCKGGLGGRVTWGMKVSLLGMVELDMNTRKETGNIRLTIIPWTNRYHLQNIFWNTSRTNTKRICGFTEAWSSIKFTLLVPARSDVAIHAHRAAPEDSDYELVHASGGHL